MVATDKLIPYARNAKKHDEAQVALIAGSIRQFGFNNPILIAEDNGIVAGHGRVRASMKLGLAEGPCIRLSHLDENQRRAYILADNRLAELGGGWDLDMLAAEMDALGEVEIDVGELGFDEAFLSLMDLTETESEVDAEAQIDKAEELRVKWGVETGQLWQLGEHRLICGDCTDKAVVDRVMGGEKADIAVTDPPYGVLSDEWDRQFNQDDLDNLIANSTGLVAIFNSAKTEIIKAILHLEPMPERMGVWRYSQIAPKPGMIWSWQPLFYWRCGDAVAWDSLDWYQGNSDKDGTHPTQKPVEFFEKIISSVKGRSVYDPFLGSGTTLIACERLGRKCRAVEISPAYCAVAIQRWVDVTGKEPVLI